MSSASMWQDTRARSITEKLALLLQAGLLARYSSPQVLDAFCTSRLAHETVSLSARCLIEWMSPASSPAPACAPELRP